MEKSEEEYEHHVFRHYSTFKDAWERDGASGIPCFMCDEESKDFDAADKWSNYGYRWREFISYVKVPGARNPLLFRDCWYWLEISVGNSYAENDIWNAYSVSFPMAKIHNHDGYFKTLKVRFFGKLNTVHHNYGDNDNEDEAMRELHIALPRGEMIFARVGWITQAHLCTHLDLDKQNVFKPAVSCMVMGKDGKIVWLPPEES